MPRSIAYFGLFLMTSFGLFSGLQALPAQSADSVQAKAKLAEVRTRIAALTNRLGDQLRNRDSLAARLREADLSITVARQRLDGLRASQRVAERQSGALRAEAVTNQRALDDQRVALARQARAAYMIGQQEQMKLLLNQNDPASAGRMLVYYGYFARERSAKIADIRDRVERMQELVGQMQEAASKLQGLQNDVEQEMKDLQHARGERMTALAAVTKQLNNGKEELDRLKHEEQAEEALVADLARVLQDFPVDSQESFEALRGKLPWPVQGRMTLRAQDPVINAGQPGFRWNGVTIDAPRSAKVRAPYFGRVVYADWLQGLGLLLIIAHSGNFMTLYGHAEVLYKSVGDWVAPGDVIAALSDTGGAMPQLYFEIRDGRRAVDPKVWLKPSP